MFCKWCLHSLHSFSSTSCDQVGRNVFIIGLRARWQTMQWWNCRHQCQQLMLTLTVFHKTEYSVRLHFIRRNVGAKTKMDMENCVKFIKMTFTRPRVLCFLLWISSKLIVRRLWRMAGLQHFAEREKAKNSVRSVKRPLVLTCRVWARARARVYSKWNRDKHFRQYDSAHISSSRMINFFKIPINYNK